MCKSTSLLCCPLWVKRGRLLILCLRDHSDLSIYWPTGKCNWFGLFSPSYATTSNLLSLVEKINDTINLSATGMNHQVVDKSRVHHFILGVETGTQVSPGNENNQPLVRSPAPNLFQRTFNTRDSITSTAKQTAPHLLKKNRLKAKQSIIFLGGLPSSKITLLQCKIRSGIFPSISSN